MANPTCPYTGKSVKVEHVQGRGWIVRGAFSIGTPMSVPRDVYELVLRRRGLNSIPSDQPLLCPYTGRPLSIKETPHGWVATGGFDAARAFSSNEELLAAITMRDGRVTPDAVATPIVGRESVRVATPPSRSRKGPSDAAVETADRTLHSLAKSIA